MAGYDNYRYQVMVILELPLRRVTIRSLRKSLMSHIDRCSISRQLQ